MSFWSEIEGVFDPGGDPAAIRGAATACQTLAADIRHIASSLDSEAADLERNWKGSASAAYEQAWSKFSAAIVDYAEGLDGAAAKLDNVADEIQSADEQAARLREVAEAALLVGAGLAIFTFGLSEAAEVGTALAAAAEADTLMGFLGSILDAATAALQGLGSALLNIATRFVIGAGFTFLEDAVAKALHGESPLDPANWDADDVSNIIVGGMVSAAVGTSFRSIGAAKVWLEGNPILGNAAYFGVNGLVSTSISEFAVDGDKLDASSVEAVAESTVLSAAVGAVFGKVLAPKLFGSGHAPDGDGSTASVPALGLAGAPDGLDVATPDPSVPDPAAASTPDGGDGGGTTPEVAQPAPVSGTPDGAAPAEQPTPPAPAGEGAGSAGPGGDGSGAAGPVPGHGDVGAGAPAGEGAGSAGPAGDGAASGGPSGDGSDQAPVSPIAKALIKTADVTGVRKSNVLRSATRAPAGGLEHILNFTPPPHLAVPSAPSAPGQVPVPHVPPPPSRIGGGTVTVRPGDSLYQIARQRLGNPNLYPVIQEANPQVGPNGVISPGQVLRIPELPAPPPGSTAQVVQPGEGLWEIAGGDPALVQQIAELNRLDDPSLIFPGQVLIIPPGA